MQSDRDIKGALRDVVDAVGLLAGALRRYASAALSNEGDSSGIGDGAKMGTSTHGPAAMGIEAALAADRRQDELAIYARHRCRLTDRQWAAVYMRLHDGLRDDQIAALLKKSRSAVHGLRSRAATIVKGCEKELRHEMHDAMRRHLDS